MSYWYQDPKCECGGFKVSTDYGYSAYCSLYKPYGGGDKQVAAPIWYIKPNEIKGEKIIPEVTRWPKQNEYLALIREYVNKEGII
jgi:hypothetical protein